jgi:hypothetical protein
LMTWNLKWSMIVVTAKPNTQKRGLDRLAPWVWNNQDLPAKKQAFRSSVSPWRIS